MGFFDPSNKLADHFRTASRFGDDKLSLEN
jgi:hypothetical protein